MHTAPTRAQRKSLRRLMRRFESRPDHIQKALCVDCLMVRFGNLWIGIEPDGYAHS